MALSSLVSVAHLADWLGVTIDTEPDLRRTEAILEAVSALVRSEAGRTWDDTEVPADVAGVIKEIAAGIWRDPHGIISQTTGPFQVRYSEAARLALTATHRRVLARYRTHHRVWTLHTYRNDLDYHDDRRGWDLVAEHPVL